METIADFMKKGGTHHTHSKITLYHTFLIVMLGFWVLGSMVEDNVKNNKHSLLFWQDFSNRFTPV